MTQKDGVDWQVNLFRLGLLVCVVGALFVATQFDIADSVAALWNNNPTTAEVSSANAMAAKSEAACRARSTGTTEYPSNCYHGSQTLKGLPLEKAVANIQGFLVAGLALLVAILLVGLFGLRIASGNARQTGRTRET